MVLLKNDGILPLRAEGRIAVIGRAAQEAHFQGGGSSHINPTQVDSPIAELKKLAGAAEITYCPGYPEDDSSQPALLAEAVAAAQAADVALLYVALPTFKESEGYDRADLELTAHQVALIQAVTAVQPRTVVILNNGSALVMSDWIDGAAAVLEAWMMGQAGGGAIADLLFGVINPSGKLAETFPLRLADTPAYISYPGEAGQVRYGEGIFIGYRYYDAREQAVLFPFGHGLSYTTFAYSAPRVSSLNFRDVDGLIVEVDVTNTGAVAGQEVVQVYVRDCAASVQRPPKELKGFAKVALQPGETQTVAVPLDGRAFAFFHPGYGRWIAEEGEFDILVGASAADMRGAVRVTLQATAPLPSLLERMSTLRQWLDDPAGRAVIAPVYEQIKAGMVATFGSSEDAGAAEDTGAMEFLQGIPLPDLLEFMGDSLPVAPAAIVDGLLHQVRG
jgi:beta-glucosidase